MRVADLVRVEPELDLLEHGIGQEAQLRILRDVANLAGQVRAGQSPRIATAEANLAGDRLQQPEREAQQRRLAAAVRPDEREPLARDDVQVDRSEHGFPWLEREPDRCRARGSGSCRAAPDVRRDGPAAPTARRLEASGSHTPAASSCFADRRSTSFGGPTSIGRPSSSSARTRSASGHASAARCSTSTIVAARRDRMSARIDEDRRRAVGIEARRRLVEDEQARLRRKHPGDRDPLLLPAGEPRGSASLEPREPDGRERLRHARPHGDHRPGEVLEPEGHVVADALHHELACRILEDDPGAEASCRDRARRVVERAGNVSGDLDVPNAQRALPRPGELARQQAGEPARERALARSGRPDDEQQLPRLDLELEIANRRSIGAGVREPRAGRADRCRWRRLRNAPRDDAGRERAAQAARLAKPSSTPVRRSDRSRRYEPPATMTSAETAIATARISCRLRSASA